MNTRQAREIVKSLEAQGWRVKRKKNGWQVFPPDRSRPPITIHETISDTKAIDAIQAQASRAGYKGKLPRH